MKPLKKLCLRVWYAAYNFWFFRTETFVGPAGRIKVWRQRFSKTISEVEVAVAGDVGTIELIQPPEHTLRWLAQCETPDNLRVKAKIALDWYGENE